MIFNFQTQLTDKAWKLCIMAEQNLNVVNLDNVKVRVQLTLEQYGLEVILWVLLYADFFSINIQSSLHIPSFHICGFNQQQIDNSSFDPWLEGDQLCRRKTWASVDFGIWFWPWKQSPVGTKGGLKFLGSQKLYTNCLLCGSWSVLLTLCCSRVNCIAHSRWRVEGDKWRNDCVYCIFIWQ